MTDFHRADETIRLGYEVTMAHLSELSRLQTVLV
jgi:NTE family protein